MKSERDIQQRFSHFEQKLMAKEEKADAWKFPIGFAEKRAKRLNNDPITIVREANSDSGNPLSDDLSIPHKKEKKPNAFPGSREYWEQRYASGGNSGVRSYDKFAAFKADFINTFIDKNAVTIVMEFGCGDGNQLALLSCPAYIGFDISDVIINACQKRFAADASKTFKNMSDYDGETAELSLSLDVIYHLVEDEVFDNFMRTLFKSNARYVIIYSSDSDDNRGFEGTWVRHRKFTRWVQSNLPAWRLIDHVPNRYPYDENYQKGSFSDFYAYEKT